MTKNIVRTTAENVICCECQNSFRLKKYKDNDRDEGDVRIQNKVLYKSPPKQHIEYLPYIVNEKSLVISPQKSPFLQRFEFGSNDPQEENDLNANIPNKKISFRNAFLNNDIPDARFKYNNNQNLAYSRDNNNSNLDLHSSNISLNLPTASIYKMDNSVSNMMPGDQNYVKSKFNYMKVDR